MYRYVILFCSVIAVRADAESEMGPPSCNRLGQITFECCKNEMMPSKPPGISYGDMKECFEQKNEFPSCERDICFAKKRGVLLDDGTFDKEKQMKELEESYKNNPKLIELYKNNCLFGDLTKYGPTDVCDMKKQHTCFIIQVIKACDEWKEDGKCSGIKEKVDECVNEFS